MKKNTENKEGYESAGEVETGCNLGCNLEDGSDNQEKLSDRLKNMREKLSISQVKLAEIVGVSTYTIQQYERGSLPKGNHSIALAKALNRSIDWLLTGEEHQPEQTAAETEAAEESRAEPEQPEPKESISQLLTKTAEILESDTIYSKALSANISAFHEATRTEKKIQEMQETMDARFRKMEEQMNELKQENEKLKDQIKDTPGDGGGMAKNAG